MDLGLSGRVAIITGGSEGIGLATARALIREGAKVALCARRGDVLDAAVADLGASALGVAGDVRVEADLARLVDAAAERFGRVDAVVNNAGTSRAGPFEGVSDAAWEEDLELKLFGAIRLVRLALPHLRRAGGGSVVNLLNIGAKQPGASSFPTSVSRGAGLALTKALSKELAPEQIRVNAVCIGVVKSAQHDRKAGGDRSAYYAGLAKQRQVPLGRVGEAEEAADLVTFLLSERARYLTGTAINLDGGASAVV